MTCAKTAILGVDIGILDIPQVLAEVNGWISMQEAHYVCVTPAHSIMECYNHPDLKQIFNHSGFNTPDGMGVVWLLRLKGYRQVQRVYGPDLLLAVCEYGLSKGWKHYFYGGAPGVAELLTQNLKARFPGLKVAGMYTPPFGPLMPEEDEMVIEQINSSGADLIWVGLSSPKQELWMYEHFGKLRSPVMLGIGAAYDFISGRKPQAPFWMQRSGLEWLFRLISEPQRLWPRYRQYPNFVFLAFRELFVEWVTQSKRRI